jgi:hypothetical protein
MKKDAPVAAMKIAAPVASVKKEEKQFFILAESTLRLQPFSW